jgi:hypothetical protein
MEIFLQTDLPMHEATSFAQDLILSPRSATQSSIWLAYGSKKSQRSLKRYSQPADLQTSLKTLFTAVLEVASKNFDSTCFALSAIAKRICTHFHLLLFAQELKSCLLKFMIVSRPSQFISFLSLQDDPSRDSLLVNSWISTIRKIVYLWE